MRITWVLCAMSALAAAEGCGALSQKKGDAGCSSGPQVGDYPADVGPIFHVKCGFCHQQPPLNGAHFSLLTYEDSQQPFGTTGMLRYQRVAQVIETNGLPHMPKVGSLTSAELITLRDWLANCAPPVAEGTGADF